MNETFLAVPPDRTTGLAGIRYVTLVVLLLVVFSLGENAVAAFNMEYRVTETALQIRSGFRTSEIPLDAKTEVRLVSDLTGARRIFGTGAPGLRTGHWRFAETGDITLYATELEPLTVIAAGDELWGITPSDPQGLMQAMETRSPATFRPVGRPGAALLSLALPLAIAVLAVGLALYGLGLLGRLPQGLRYELGPDGITLRTGLRPVRIGYEEVAGVEVASPAGFPLRIAGAAVGGLLWGRFRWPEAGPNLRLYATRFKPLVLLHAKDGRTIGITPEQQERFVEAVRQRMG